MNQHQLFDEAPVDLRVGNTEELVIVLLFFAIAAVGTGLALRGQRGSDRTFTLLALAGAAVCIVFEPALARAGGFWYTSAGQDFGLPTMWGVSVGLHMVFGYYVFLGVASIFVARYIGAGRATSRELWIVYLATVGMGVALELPVLAFTDVYTYYGENQPFYSEDLWPLPLWYPIVNASLPLAMAMVMVLVRRAGRSYVWLLPLIMPMGLFAIYSAEAWPVLTALNSGTSKLVCWLAGAVTMGFAILATQLLIKGHLALAPERRDAPDVAESQSATPVAA